MTLLRHAHKKHLAHVSRRVVHRSVVFLEALDDVAEKLRANSCFELSNIIVGFTKFLQAFLVWCGYRESHVESTGAMHVVLLETPIDSHSEKWHLHDFLHERTHRISSSIRTIKLGTAFD